MFELAYSGAVPQTTECVKVRLLSFVEFTSCGVSDDGHVHAAVVGAERVNAVGVVLGCACHVSCLHGRWGSVACL